MAQFNHDDILRLRAQFWQAEWIHYNQDQLAVKREEYEGSIQNLKSQAELYRHQIHQGPSEKQSQADLMHLEKQMQANQKQLEQARQSQYPLDLLLDECEDLTFNSLLNLQAQLLECIWTVYPKQRLKWEEKWQEFQQKITLEEQLGHLKNIFLELQKNLQTAIQKRQSIKGKGFFNYIFGISPNAVIERQLVNSSQLIQKALPYLQRIQTSPSSLSVFLLDTQVQLEKLKDHCHTPWGFRHIDTIFTDASQHMELTQILLKEHLERVIGQKNHLKKEIEEWLKKL